MTTGSFGALVTLAETVAHFVCSHFVSLFLGFTLCSVIYSLVPHSLIS